MKTSDILAELYRVDSELDPENLSADGERSVEEAQQLESSLLKQRADLQEKLLVLTGASKIVEGLPVSVNEIFVNLAGGGENTLLEYEYRDESNWKTRRRVVLSGRIDVAGARTIVSRLDDGSWLIPGQVNLPDLQDSFIDPSEWDEDRDHVWHELHGISYTNARPTEEGLAVEDVVNSFQHIVWDTTYKPSFYEEMVERRNKRVGK